MSIDGSISLIWGDGENSFRFAIGQFRELQEKINHRRALMAAPLIGPMTLLNLIRSNDAWPDDVRDVLRIGLVGAGMTPTDAHRKLVQYFDVRPFLESNLIAFAILSAGLIGDPNDQAAGDQKKTTPDQNSQSDTAPFMGQVLQ